MTTPQHSLITFGTPPSVDCTLRPCLARRTPGVMIVRDAGLRPTRQRIALAQLIFGNGDRHVCAEMLGIEAANARLNISMATIYNTLHQFTDAGLLRSLALDGTRLWFDTNTSNHHHFYCERSGELRDIPDDALAIGALPELPEDMELAGVNVTIRLRPRQNV